MNMTTKFHENAKSNRVNPNDDLIFSQADKRDDSNLIPPNNDKMIRGVNVVVNFRMCASSYVNPETFYSILKKYMPAFVGIPKEYIYNKETNSSLKDEDKVGTKNLFLRLVRDKCQWYESNTFWRNCGDPLVFKANYNLAFVKLKNSDEITHDIFKAIENIRMYFLQYMSKWFSEEYCSDEVKDCLFGTITHPSNIPSHLKFYTEVSLECISDDIWCDN